MTFPNFPLHASRDPTMSPGGISVLLKLRSPGWGKKCWKECNPEKMLVSNGEAGARGGGPGRLG